MYIAYIGVKSVIHSIYNSSIMVILISADVHEFRSSASVSWLFSTVVNFDFNCSCDTLKNPVLLSSVWQWLNLNWTLKGHVNMKAWLKWKFLKSGKDSTMKTLCSPRKCTGRVLWHAAFYTVLHSNQSTSWMVFWWFSSSNIGHRSIDSTLWHNPQDFQSYMSNKLQANGLILSQTRELTSANHNKKK